VGDVIAEAVSEGRLRADGSVLYATGRLSPGVWFDVITESLCGEGRDLRSPEMH
jgi:hypothetical protein